MNKEQFLFELRQYLTFVTPEERTQVLDEYRARFDEAGEAGEAALLPELGTPMMIAIALKRRKEAGEPLCDHAPAPKAPSENSPEPAASPAAEKAAPDAPEAEAAEVSDEYAEESEAESAPEDAEDEAESPARQAPAKARVGAGAVISCVLLSLLSAVLALAIAAVGVYFLAVFGNLLVVAFQSLNAVTQALLLFAGALVSGGIGVVIVWLGIWTGIRLIAKQFARLRS